MSKTFQLIHLNKSTNKTHLMNALLIYNISCFGIGNHILVIDVHPKGVNIPISFKGVNIKNVIQKPLVKKWLKACQAQLLHFDTNAFKALLKWFKKQYILTNQSKSTLSFKSRTQKANFTIHNNGLIRTSKDLQDIDLLDNIVKIVYGEKPFDPTDTL